MDGELETRRVASRVGEDQASPTSNSHGEILRRFNNFYSWKIFSGNFTKPGNDTFVRVLYNLLFFRYWSDGAPEFRGTRGSTAGLLRWITGGTRQAV